jgi:hypothetical protein
MKRLALFLFIGVLSRVAPSFAQDSDPLKIKVQVEGPGSAGFLLQREGEARSLAQQGEIFYLDAEIAGRIEVVKNSPFTATRVVESTQTLADGNHIVTKSSSFQARDSQGRTRREETFNKMGPLKVEGPSVVFIDDPVTHTNVVLQPAQRAARIIRRDDNSETTAISVRRKLEDMQKVKVYSRIENNAAKADVKHEDLGMEVIEGVTCQGTRETVTIPAGQIGNEQPIVTTTEIWSSDDLHGVVLKKHSDPRFGETVYRLTNIKLGEPDSSLFQVPSGYKTTKGEGIFSKE